MVFEQLERESVRTRLVITEGHLQTNAKGIPFTPSAPVTPSKPRFPPHQVDWNPKGSHQSRKDEWKFAIPGGGVVKTNVIFHSSYKLSKILSLFPFNRGVEGKSRIRVRNSKFPFIFFFIFSTFLFFLLSTFLLFLLSTFILSTFLFSTFLLFYFLHFYFSTFYISTFSTSLTYLAGWVEGTHRPDWRQGW